MVMVAMVEAEPAKCCFDKEYSAVLGEAGGTVVNGHAVGLDGTVTLGYDFYRKRQGSKTQLRQPDNTMQTTFSLQDFANKVQYLTDDNGQCTARHMTDAEEMYPPCVPDNARYLGNATFGYGTETLYIDSWEFTVPNSDVLTKLAVTDACVPVVEALYGHMGGASTELTYFFTAYHPGIEDLNSLIPPANCPFPAANSTAPVGRRSIRGFNF